MDNMINISPYSQLFGHQRSPSMENFKEMTKRDAQMSLSHELIKLRKTSNLTQERNDLIDKEFEGFQRLFSQYLAADVAAPIQWEKIEKLPQGSVSLSAIYILQ